MGEPIIRRAQARDAKGLAECIDLAYAIYAGRISDLPPVSAHCADEIADHLVWVAELNGKIVGGVVLIPDDGYMKLANVAVHPDQRGAGLGRRLMTLAETEAISRGYHEMRLNTHKDMPENVELYARNGWSLIGLEENRVTMRKQLARS